jgi:hypothetical protein
LVLDEKFEHLFFLERADEDLVAEAQIFLRKIRFEGGFHPSGGGFGAGQGSGIHLG